MNDRLKYAEAWNREHCPEAVSECEDELALEDENFGLDSEEYFDEEGHLCDPETGAPLP